MICCCKICDSGVLCEVVLKTKKKSCSLEQDIRYFNFRTKKKSQAIIWFAWVMLW